MKKINKLLLLLITLALLNGFATTMEAPKKIYSEAATYKLLTALNNAQQSFGALFFPPEQSEIDTLANTINGHLMQGANPNKVSLHQTPLISAIKTQIPRIVEMLLNAGADPNFQDHNGNTALMFAMQDGNQEIVKLLLANVANPNIQNKRGNTALMGAIYYGKDAVVPLLIEYGAHINLKNKDGDTALIIAAGKGNSNSVRLLLENSADKTITNNGGKTALDIAKEKNNPAIINLLQNPPPRNPIRKLI